MNYTKNEQLAISDATLAANTHTNAALYLLTDFMEMYLSTNSGVRDLISILESNSDRIYIELHAISLMIREAKLDLDIFSGVDSSLVDDYLWEANERKEMYNLFRNKAV